MRLRRRNGTLARDTGKLGVRAGRSSPSCPPHLLTLVRPTVPGRANSGSSRGLRETHVPHTAVCFTETYAHALCSACPGIWEEGPPGHTMELRKARIPPRTPWPILNRVILALPNCSAGKRWTRPLAHQRP